VGINAVRTAVFLDRDGVINPNVFYEDTGTYESPRSASAFNLFPDAIESLQELQRQGFLLFLVSNQPNVAKGKSTLEELQGIHAKFQMALDKGKICFAEYYYCYHHPDSSAPIYGGPCVCRKPSPYFLKKAAEDHHVDLMRSWMVGDRLSDIECGKQAGVRTILISTDHILDSGLPREHSPDWVVGSLREASCVILEQR
jgi:D-glycero-D-manno-heptose 1,7-bisphosphate phosphatase